ncbi:ABC transporter substrate-binding protein [Leifsonia poae]|uniref:ABC transporter substrate-binding protein n=1 Tax=Leifsonia poae TaxID=110933 RepID=UPI001CBC73CF|nr:ABC transporter substrate-binding protein [Leifsonia poae]
MTISSRTKRVLASLAGATVVLTALAACSPADSAASGGTATSGSGKVTDVTIQIDGSAVPYYAPLYEAADKGYFADNGLNVSFTYAQGSDILQNVAAGNVQFGFPNGDSVVTAKGKGVDVDVVHTTYQQGIGAVLFNKDTSGITGPADLKGKTIAVTDLGSPNYIQLQAILKSAGLTVNDVTVKTIGTGAIVQALQSGQVDAIVFSRLRYFALQSAGFPVGQILSDKYLPSFGNVLVTSPSFRKSNPAAVKGFDAALDKGLEYVIANPAAAVKDAIAKYAQTFNGQEDAVTNVVKDVYIKDLWQSAETDKHGLGYGDLSRWQKAIDAQADYKLIDSSYSAKTLVVEPDALK